ncbi:MAG: HNH endonuclease [Candidatus Caccovivens sp.]
MNYHKKYKSFYNSKEWKQIKSRKFQEAEGLCEQCLKAGVVRAGVDVHHIVPVEKNWNKRLEYSNLILLCKECHNARHGRGGSLSDFLKIWEE